MYTKSLTTYLISVSLLAGACSPIMKLDESVVSPTPVPVNSKPTVTIAAPTSLNLINSYTALTTYAVSGSCSENGLPVTISVSSGATVVHPTASPICSALTYSATVNLSSLADGTLTFTAAHSNAAGVAATLASVLVMKDTLVPTLASATITNSTPTTSQTFNLTYGAQAGGTYASYCILENSTTQSSCSFVTGALPSSFSVSATSNAKVLSFWLKDASGNISTRVDSNSVVLAPAAPSGLTLNTPSFTPASSSTPIIAVAGVSSGDSVKIYSDSSCTVLQGTVSSAGSSANVTSSALTASTLYHFYATTTSSGGATSLCSTATVSYTFQNPVLTFSRDVFTINGAGTILGQTITVTRDIAGGTHAVTLISDAITALSGGQFTAGTQTVSFAAADTSITVPASSFTPVVTATIQGDNFFRIKLSSPTNGATLGAVPEAVVNMLDSQLTQNYFFEKPIYTTLENAGTVSILIGREGSTAAAATVQVTFIDGTAVGGTDYTATPITVNFAIGAAEATAAIPILNRTSYQANRSFYIELKSPSAGTKSRAWATAKVRVLDVNDATICDSTNVNTAVNLGFGGGAGTSGNPYLICSLPQLFKVRNNLALFYRVTADLDLDPSIDADSATGGVQAMSPCSGTLTGGFNGDEHLLKNFRYTTSTSSPIALFSNLGGNTSVLFTGVNLIQSTVANTNSNGDVAGLVGKLNSSMSTLSNNLFSGYVSSTSVTAGGILNRSAATLASPLTRNFAHGLISGANTSDGDAGGIFAGHYDSGNATDLDHCYSTATVVAGEAGGGLLGWFNYVGGSSGSITASHSKGTIIGVGSSVEIGGLAGTDQGGTDNHVASSFSDSNISGGYNSGGLFGSFSCKHDPCISTSYTTGAITSGGHLLGGLIGQMYSSSSATVTIDSVYSTGDLTTSAATAGGLIGGMYVSDTNQNISLTNSYSTSNITNPTNASTGGFGGIVGNLYAGSGYGNTVTLNHVYSSGTISTSTGYSVGGLLGQINDATSDGSNTYVIQNSYSTGNVTGFRQVGGVAGEVYSSSSHGSTITFTGNYASGNISSVDQYVGGIFGEIQLDGPSSVSVGTNYSTGTVIATSAYAGGGVGLVYLDSASSSLSFTNSYATGNVTGPYNVGGFFGEINLNTNVAESMTVTQVHATGVVTGSGGSADSIGGFVGEIDCTGTGSKTLLIQRSYATGNASGKDSIGGFVGSTSSSASCTHTFLNDYATGSVAASASNAGGFAGWAQGNSSSIAFNNVYTNAPSITDPDTFSIGGLVGKQSSISISNSYWLRDTSINTNITSDANAKTVAQLQTTGTYSGWDFSTIWNAPSSGVYPSLR